MQRRNRAFTLVELIVVIAILAILGTIAFLSLQGYSTNARDSSRVSDISSMKTSLELFQLDAGKYAEPTGGVNIIYSGSVVWTQGLFGDSVYTNVTKLEKKPIDPLTEKEYTYSVTDKKNEYELSGILEGDVLGFNETATSQVNAGDALATAMVSGNYNGLMSKTLSGAASCYALSLPTIISSDVVTSTDLLDIINNGKLVYDGYNNLPSSFEGTKFKQDGGFGFLPNKLLAYSDTGSCELLIDKTNAIPRLTLLKGLQDSYTGTILKDVGEIKNILDLVIDLNAPSTGAINYAGTFVNNVLGGKVVVEGSNVSSGTGSSGTGELTCSNLTQGEKDEINTYQGIPIAENEWCSITSLYLDGNSLDHVPTGVYKLKTLTYLDLSDNLIPSLSSDIGNLTNLTYLNLYLNRLETIPSQIGILTNLTELYVSSNLLTTLPSELVNLVGLIYLDLSNNASLGDFNNYFDLNWGFSSQNGILSNGKTITIYGNGVNIVISVVTLSCATTPTSGTIPQLLETTVGTPDIENKPWTYSATPGTCTYTCNSGFVGNNCATDLAVCNATLTQGEADELNTLTSQSLSISQWCSETTLDLSYGIIGVPIPTGVYKLAGLNYLDLSNNGIESISSDIGNLVNLTDLYLQDNALTNLPTEFTSLTNLVSLNLDNNTDLGYLGTYYDVNSNLVLWDGIPINGKTMNISGNGINIEISISDTILACINQVEAMNLNNSASRGGEGHPIITNNTPTEWCNETNVHFYSSVPIAVFKLANLTELTIPNGLVETTDIPADIGNMVNLTSLSIIGGNITSLPAEIGLLTNLTSLELQENSLVSLPNEISELTSLITLDLNTNQLESLPSSFGDLTSLTTLNLNTNQLTSLPSSIGTLDSLPSLNLSNNLLGSLPTEIGGMASLTSIGASYNQLTSLPSSIGDLTSLTSLDLSNNLLESLPTEIGYLTNLIGIGLNDNKLTSLPESFGDLTNLGLGEYAYDLDLSHNELTTLPSSFGSLIHITGLKLNNNKISSLPSSIGLLSGIHYIDDNSPGFIDLQNNKLTSLPDEIGDITNLIHLFLDNNLLTTLPSGLKNLNSLITLSTSGNTGLGNLNGYFSSRYWYPRIDISQTSITPAGETMRVKTEGWYGYLIITAQMPPSCASQPGFGVEHTEGTPTVPNQEWTFSNTLTGACVYRCDNAHTGSGCTSPASCDSYTPHVGGAGGMDNLDTGTILGAQHPTTENQAWTFSTTNGYCTYGCVTGWTGTNCATAE